MVPSKTCILATIVLLFVQAEAQGNNVCKKFWQYWLKGTGCHYNPDQFSEIWDVVERNGYSVTHETVTTQDGYILTVFRIPRPGAKPVFLQHGISLSAIGFTDTLNSSLAYVLYEAGYDVWLGNFRGNRYANRHISLNSSQEQFWDFSFHEMGLYDLKAQLDLVYAKTKQKIYYIGFSMGTTASYIYNILRPQESTEKLDLIVSLAPIVYLKHVPSSVAAFAPLWPIIEPLVRKFTPGVVLEKNANSNNTAKFCTSNPLSMMACAFVIQSIFGFDFPQINPETFPVTFTQNSDAVSTKTISHYVQFIGHGKFQFFNYGRKGNRKRYGKDEAPLYSISRMTVPVYLVHAKNDYFATTMNVKKFYKELPEGSKKNGKYLVPYRKFNHADFLNAKDVKTMLYDHLVDFLKTANVQ